MTETTETVPNTEMNNAMHTMKAVTMCATLTVRQSRKARLRKTAISLGKKSLVFLISHVGLTCLVVVYSILGGFIFMYLEANNELQNRNAVARVRKLYVKELWEATEKLNILFMDNWTAIADDVFMRFQASVYSAVDNGWDGVDEHAAKLVRWTYPGALLFSVTVITTIGYGHLTPQTVWGRVVTMLYALIGIPLTLLCLSNIGGLMAGSFRLLWKQIVCRCCRMRKRRQTSLRQRSSLRNPSVAGSEPLSMPEQSAKEGKKKKKDLVRVPIAVCLLLIFIYIMLGAVLFTLWEEDWSFLESAYFCFITLSTIGFGDFVPGHSNSSWEDNAKRVSSVLYLLFGLAMMAMSFDLMQGEVKDLCQEFARSLGLCKRKTPENV